MARIHESARHSVFRRDLSRGPPVRRRIDSASRRRRLAEAEESRVFRVAKRSLNLAVTLECCTASQCTGSQGEVAEGPSLSDVSIARGAPARCTKRKVAEIEEDEEQRQTPPERSEVNRQTCTSYPCTCPDRRSKGAVSFWHRISAIRMHYTRLGRVYIAPLQRLGEHTHGEASRESSRPSRLGDDAAPAETRLPPARSRGPSGFSRSTTEHLSPTGERTRSSGDSGISLSCETAASNELVTRRFY